MFNKRDVNSKQDINPYLLKERKFNYMIQPSGYHTDSNIDFWVHMEFSYSSHTAEVVVDVWWITDAVGTEVSLSKIPYSAVQFLCEAMTEEFNYQVDTFYAELENDYYSSLKRAE